MKARLPEEYQPKSQKEMMRQVQKAQEDMQRLQEELEAREYSASAGGGMVEVVMDGKHTLRSITIKPEVVNPEDVEMLQDLVAAAINEANRVVEETSDTEMNAITEGLNLPGMQGLF